MKFNIHYTPWDLDYHSSLFIPTCMSYIPLHIMTEKSKLKAHWLFNFQWDWELQSQFRTRIAIRWPLILREHQAHSLMIKLHTDGSIMLFTLHILNSGLRSNGCKVQSTCWITSFVFSYQSEPLCNVWKHLYLLFISSFIQIFYFPSTCHSRQFPLLFTLQGWIITSNNNVGL